MIKHESRVNKSNPEKARQFVIMNFLSIPVKITPYYGSARIKNVLNFYNEKNEREGIALL